MIFVSYPSALTYWLNGTNRGDLKKPYRLLDFQPSSCEKPQGGAALPDLPYPITIMISSRAGRYRNNYYNYVSVHSVFPKAGFVNIGGGVCVASPELCFLLAAKDYTFAQLVELGNNLCASYVFDANRNFGQRARDPITTAENIRNYLLTCRGCQYIDKAAKAAAYIKNNSGSPMESTCGAFFFLSKCHGGYALKDGLLNAPVILSPIAVRLLGTEKCRGDILWEEDKTVFEYDSSLTHNDPRQRETDARRQSAMNQSGYKIVRYTADSVRSFDSFENTTLALMDDLNMRKKTSIMEKYKYRRREVYNELFASPHPFFIK